MAKATKPAKETERQENLQETVSKTEQFFTQNGKILGGILIGAVVVGLAILGWQRFIYQPKCEEAAALVAEAENTYMNAEQSFAAGDLQAAAASFETALNGVVDTLSNSVLVSGFAQIIDDYGKKGGEAVYMYAGVCAYKIGLVKNLSDESAGKEDFETALGYFSKYSTNDPVFKARAIACQGDCQSALGEYAKAAALYEKAAGVQQNVFAAGYLLKAGQAYEALGDKAAALECYQTVKDDYLPEAQQAYQQMMGGATTWEQYQQMMGAAAASYGEILTIDKYINRVQE